MMGLFGLSEKNGEFGVCGVGVPADPAREAIFGSERVFGNFFVPVALLVVLAGADDVEFGTSEVAFGLCAGISSQVGSLAVDMARPKLSRGTVLGRIIV